MEAPSKSFVTRKLGDRQVSDDHSKHIISTADHPQDDFDLRAFYRANTVEIRRSSNTLKCPDCGLYTTYRWLDDGWRLLISKHHQKGRNGKPDKKSPVCDSRLRVFIAKLAVEEAESPANAQPVKNSAMPKTGGFRTDRTLKVATPSVGVPTSKVRKADKGKKNERTVGKASATRTLGKSGTNKIKAAQSSETKASLDQPQLRYVTLQVENGVAECPMCHKSVEVRVQKTGYRATLALHYGWSKGLCETRDVLFNFKRIEPSNKKPRSRKPRKKGKELTPEQEARHEKARRQRISDNYALYAADSFGTPDLGYGESGGTSVRALLGGNPYSNRQRH